jgi:hypothetical protein
MMQVTRRGSGPWTLLIARAVADAIESPGDPFRWPVGPDAEALLAARAKLDDKAFEAALRSTMKIEW